MLTLLNISSKTTGHVVTKFHVEPPGAEGTKICLDCCPCHMINKVGMPIYGKTCLKFFFSGTSGLMALKVGM